MGSLTCSLTAGPLARTDCFRDVQWYCITEARTALTLPLRSTARAHSHRRHTRTHTPTHTPNRMLVLTLTSTALTFFRVAAGLGTGVCAR